MRSSCHIWPTRRGNGGSLASFIRQWDPAPQECTPNPGISMGIPLGDNQLSLGPPRVREGPRAMKSELHARDIAGELARSLYQECPPPLSHPQPLSGAFCLPPSQTSSGCDSCSPVAGAPPPSSPAPGSHRAMQPPRAAGRPCVHPPPSRDLEGSSTLILHVC